MGMFKITYGEMRHGSSRFIISGKNARVIIDAADRETHMAFWIKEASHHTR